MRNQSVTFVLSVAALSACEPMEPPAEDVSSVSEACCGAIGLCVPPGLVSTELEQRLPSAECPESWICAPTEWIIGATYVPANCRAVGDLEGRCLPSCMPELAHSSSPLQQGSCEAGFLCAPCFDPLTGKDTQACRIAPDEGPREPAPELAECCNGDGRCAPRAALQAFSDEELEALGSAGCESERDMLCVPQLWFTPEEPSDADCGAADQDFRRVNVCREPEPTVLAAT